MQDSMAENGVKMVIRKFKVFAIHLQKFAMQTTKTEVVLGQFNRVPGEVDACNYCTDFRKSCKVVANATTEIQHGLACEPLESNCFGKVVELLIAICLDLLEKLLCSRGTLCNFPVMYVVVPKPFHGFDRGIRSAGYRKEFAGIHS